MVAILLDYELIPITSEQAENACTAGYKCPDEGRTRAIFNSRVGGLKSAQKNPSDFAHHPQKHLCATYDIVLKIQFS